MRKFLLMIAILGFTLTSCITISTSQPTHPTPLFITSTLPATNTPFITPVTPSPSGTAPTLSITAAPNCKDKAVLVQDVTIADGTNILRGAKFTKTWQFQNTGTCLWIGYSIAFVSGDRMSAPDSSPIPQTAPKSTVNVSVDLTAPTSDGAYTGFFELRNANDEAIDIGIEKTFWVKITVGVVIAPPTGTSIGAGTPAVAPTGPLSCKYIGSPSYPAEIANLINSARTKAGLAALTINSQLAAAAQGHSIDMACFSLLSHTGSNSSTPYQRVSASGYSGTYRQEIIYAGGYPQDAFNWWMNEPVHHDAVLDPSATEMGVGYAYVTDSAYGGYYTVDFGSR
ncbi:MAG TPA: NBR1-Ig-like domain-containing protein [Anaerolineales bacterium]|nr:NBR1-Ig-like domain-containing protein [Anaerolineales bacterium]